MRFNTYYIVMSFLDQVWKTLESRKTKHLLNPDIQLPEPVYPGYRTIPIQKLQRLKGPRTYECDGRNMMSECGKRNMIYFEENVRLGRREPNGFFGCYYQAYMAHGDLKMKPDQVWMIILMWFVKYVNDNAEQLRRAFVSHQGKKKLMVTIRCDGEEIDWPAFFPLMLERIKENTVAGVTDRLSCNFSCSGQFDRIFSTAAIMSGFKKYFDYAGKGAGCGVVNVHMAGALQDWQLLVQKLDNLLQYDVDGKLKRYVLGLRPVLQQFVETYKGYAHLEFWNNLYHQRLDPTIPSYDIAKVVNGWLIKFFTSEENLVTRPGVQTFTVGIAFRNATTNQDKKLTLLGATQGYSIEDGCVYRPQFAYGIAEEKKENIFVIRRTTELTDAQRRKRERGFQVASPAQLAEERRKREGKKKEEQKLPLIKVRQDYLRAVYGVIQKGGFSRQRRP